MSVNAMYANSYIVDCMCVSVLDLLYVSSNS